MYQHAHLSDSFVLVVIWHCILLTSTELFIEILIQLLEVRATTVGLFHASSDVDVTLFESRRYFTAGLGVSFDVIFLIFIYVRRLERRSVLKCRGGG
jgi:hypothetical protein